MSTLYEFTLRVQDALGNSVLLPDSITVLDPVTEPGTVTLAGRTITATAETTQGVNRTTTTTITLNADGTLTTSDGFSSTTEWGVGVVASEWEALVTPLEGATFTGSPTGVWVSLADSPSWSEQFTSNASGGTTVTQVTAMEIQIRDVATASVATSAVFFHDHRITPVPAEVRLTSANYVGRAEEYGGAAAQAYVTFDFANTGALSVIRTVIVGDSPSTTVVPGEWGNLLSPSDFEIKFDIVSSTPGDGIVFLASPNFGVWGTLATGASMSMSLLQTFDGTISANCTVRATIRPVGGSPIATADYGVTLFATSNPGEIP